MISINLFSGHEEPRCLTFGLSSSRTTVQLKLAAFDLYWPSGSRLINILSPELPGEYNSGLMGMPLPTERSQGSWKPLSSRDCKFIRFTSSLTLFLPLIPIFRRAATRANGWINLRVSPDRDFRKQSRLMHSAVRGRGYPGKAEVPRGAELPG